MNIFFSQYKDTPGYIVDLSRKNRNNPTIQEEKLWLQLSGKKIDGFKFRRQFPIGRYIVDFYNHANRLIIEVDGEIHEKTREYDVNRDAYLTACGNTVLRFSNSEVDESVDAVLLRIKEHLRTSPPKSPAGGL